MVYASVKDWDRALFMFTMCITVPAMAVSHVMLEAYKKHLVISLIHCRKLVPLPKYTSSVVNRFFKHLALPYHDLANAYAQNDVDEFKNLIVRHTETFQRFVKIAQMNKNRNFDRCSGFQG
jgi:COP9 signalosome complex subunit 3